MFFFPQGKNVLHGNPTQPFVPLFWKFISYKYINFGKSLGLGHYWYPPAKRIVCLADPEGGG